MDAGGRTADTMNRLGVSASFLDRFCALNAALLASNPTTRSVAADAVTPAAQPTQVAFIRLFADEQDGAGQPLVSKANVYVSHAWFERRQRVVAAGWGVRERQGSECEGILDFMTE